MTRPATSPAPTQADPRPTIPAIPPTDVLRQIALLRDAPTADLKQHWRELFGKEPPPFSRPFLQNRLAYRIQEVAYGGLQPESVARLEAMGERLDGGNITLRRIRADDRPIAGTRLVREHHGIEHVVTVLNHGFEYDGRPYRSLSAIARAITGTRWNGWTFFGLNCRRGAA
jgi:Protein of unknown function (DUF2924)